NLRHRLRYARWNLYSRLHSHPRSRQRSYSGSRQSRQRLLQPRHGWGFQGTRSDRIGPQNHWTKNRDDRKTTQTGRPAPAHRFLKENREGTWLATAIPIARRDCRERLEMASEVSTRLRKLRPPAVLL